MRSLALLALGPLLIFSAQALAQNEPFLVKDIRPGSTGSEPGRLANLNGTLLFSANDGILGEELWKSDGTAEGTVLVKDINPGLESGFSGNFYPWSPAKVNGTLFFAADDGSTGYELWKSDGTAEGTVLVKDINPGSNGSTPKYCANLNGTLFFGASEGVFGRELWRSDGTEAGTVLVKDIRPGSNSSDPYYMTNVNGTLFFKANDGLVGEELWKSDGRPGGTVFVKDIRPGSYSSTPAHLANLNGTLFFAADDGILGHELWKSDGTAEGTVLVKDIRPGGNSEPADLTNVNGTLFFMANDGILGHELWKSDGTAEGTVLVKNINPGSGSSIPHTFSTSLTNVNGTLFFGASEGVFGRELWRSDGAEAGTVLVKDINSGTESSIHPHFLPLMNVNGTLFVSANNGTLGEELWALNVSPEAPALSPILTALLAMSLLGAGFTFARTRGPKAR